MGFLNYRALKRQRKGRARILIDHSRRPTAVDTSQPAGVAALTRAMGGAAAAAAGAGGNGGSSLGLSRYGADLAAVIRGVQARGGFLYDVHDPRFPLIFKNNEGGYD